jgi:hypothetical protein
MGTRFGNTEARYTLDLVNSVVNLPLFVKIFVEEGGL